MFIRFLRDGIPAGFRLRSGVLIIAQQLKPVERGFHIRRLFFHRKGVFQRVSARLRILIAAQRIELRRGGLPLPFLLQLVGIGIDGAVQRLCGLRVARELLKPVDRGLIVARFHGGTAKRQRRVAESVRRILVISGELQLVGGFFQLARAERVHARHIAAVFRARLRFFVYAKAFVQLCGGFILARFLLLRRQRIAALADERHRVADVRDQHELVARRLIFPRAHQLTPVEVDAVLALRRRVAVIAQ